MSTTRFLINSSEVWAGALSEQMYRKRQVQAQPQEVLRLASIYLLVSETTLLVISGVISNGFHTAKRRSIYLRKGWGDKKPVAHKWKLAHSAHGGNLARTNQVVDGSHNSSETRHWMGPVFSTACIYYKGVVHDAYRTSFFCSRWDLHSQRFFFGGDQILLIEKCIAG